MGVNITANNSSINFKMSYGQFHSLRRNIAEAIDPEFAKLYHEATAFIYLEDGIKAERAMNKYITDNAEYLKYTEEVFDFLFQSDVDGEVDYRTCKKILDIIEHVDFKDNNFQYVAYRTSENDYEKFKKFLKECVRYHRKMRWS